MAKPLRAIMSSARVANGFVMADNIEGMRAGLGEKVCWREREAGSTRRSGIAKVMERWMW
jgi:hypothetical protein